MNSKWEIRLSTLTTLHRICQVDLCPRNREEGSILCKEHNRLDRNGAKLYKVIE